MRIHTFSEHVLDLLGLELALYNVSATVDILSPPTRGATYLDD